MDAEDRRTHLVLLVHGLFGSRAHWKYIATKLSEALDPGRYLIHSSDVNEFKKTYEGIDGCGERLAAEIETMVSEHPTLSELSLIGHSMGGLISRYAAGRLLDPTTGLVAGLRPVHYVSIATPHLGCDTAPGPAIVPLVRWLNFAGLGWFTARAAGPFSDRAFKRSGSQFFLRDHDESRRSPLLWRLAGDYPEHDELFYSALWAFETRTAYANRSGDHLVSWANASVRAASELPEIRKEGLGVVREDPLRTAWPDERSAMTLEILTRLQQLDWRRVDVCFADSKLHLLSHQHIQTQREWLNRAGRRVAAHLAEQLAAMEALRRGESEAPVSG